MLANANEQDGDIGGVDQADEGADHVADCIAFGDDEAVKRADGPEGRVEVAGLGDGVCTNQCLWDKLVRCTRREEKYTRESINIPRRP